MDQDKNKAKDQIDAIGAAMGLTEAVAALTEEVKEVKGDERRTRRLARLLVVSLVLDLLLTVGIGFLSVNNHSLNTRIQQSQVASCRAGNVVRSDDTKLWTTAINDIDPASKTVTPAEVASKAKFIKFIDSTFAPVDCSKLAG